MSLVYMPQRTCTYILSEMFLSPPKPIEYTQTQKSTLTPYETERLFDTSTENWKRSQATRLTETGFNTTKSTTNMMRRGALKTVIQPGRSMME